MKLKYGCLARCMDSSTNCIDLNNGCLVGSLKRISTLVRGNGKWVVADGLTPGNSKGWGNREILIGVRVEYDSEGSVAVAGVRIVFFLKDLAPVNCLSLHSTALVGSLKLISTLDRGNRKLVVAHGLTHGINRLLAITTDQRTDSYRLKRG